MRSLTLVVLAGLTGLACPAGTTTPPDASLSLPEGVNCSATATISGDAAALSSALAAAGAGSCVIAQAGTATGLVWQRAVVAQSFDLVAAQSACQSLSLGGFSSGWRLPAKKELEALVDRRVAFPGPTIDAAAFPGTPAEPFWTATPVTGWPGYAWSLGFDDGATGGGKGTQNTARIRCVR